MTPKSGNRFPDKVMPPATGMTPKSGIRFSDKVMPPANGVIERYHMVVTAVSTISWA
jgi:hypothetical protein